MQDQAERDKLRRRAWAFHLCRPMLALVAGCHRITVEGTRHLPQEGPALLLVKHRATRDSLLLSWLLYRHTGRMANYLMKYGAAGLPPGLLEIVGGIPVIRPKDILRLETRAQRRSRLQAARALYQQALDYVTWLYTEGELVVVYPEGAFYADTLGPLQTGCLHHAYALTEEDGLDVPLIPIGLAYQHRRGRRTEAVFRIGTPCKPTAFARFEALVDIVRRQLRTLSGLN